MKFRKIIAAVTSLCLAVPAGIAGTVSALDQNVKGDVNADTVFNLADMVMFQRWLSGRGDITAHTNADVNGDGEYDIFDLSTMRKMLVENISNAPQPSFAPSARNLCAGISASDIKGKDADEQFINSQASFTVDLFKKTYAEKVGENDLISPYSVMQALSMTANGAGGTTRKEMENVLGGGLSMDALNSYLMTQRQKTVNTEKNEYKNKWEINTANSIWARDDQNRIQVRPEFIQKCVDYYDSEFYLAPFDESTLNDVNGWVNEKTHEMIPKILEYIDYNDVMYLVNAVTFEAEWEQPYESYNVKKDKFTAADGTVQDAEMLCSTEKYITDETNKGMMKYYSGYRYAFAALLPDESISVDDYIEQLTAEKLSGLLNNNSYEQANVKLPKFKYEYGNELSDELKAMGIKTAFDEETADFSEMSSINDLNPLHIGYVIHKTFIDLDENGTKAAAATLVAMKDNGMPIKPEVDVVFDRPFVYCIVDTETELPVFIGVLNSLEQ